MKGLLTLIITLKIISVIIIALLFFKRLFPLIFREELQETAYMQTTMSLFKNSKSKYQCSILLFNNGHSKQIDLYLDSKQLLESEIQLLWALKKNNRLFLNVQSIKIKGYQMLTNEFK